MNLLMLGGSVFLGRHLVRAARLAGHTITTFNRGNHNLAEQADVERLLGDRNNFALPAGRSWDAVIDTCGMEIDAVYKSADKIRSSVGKYVFISSISAFENFRESGMTERSPARLLPLNTEQDYGSKKAHCEKIVSDVFAKRSLIIRPGLIVGRFDPSDRFTYWPRRIAKGGQVLAPGRPERAVQFIDVRDLSQWIIRLIEANISGTFNATGPGFVFSMKELLDKCKEVSQSQAEFIWLADELLIEEAVTPWSELPLWIPESDCEYRGFMQIDCNKAQNTGLSYRTPGETIEDILSWDANRDQAIRLKAGLDPAREELLISALPSDLKHIGGTP